MKLILHIGMPKTGSSALQGSLRAARWELRKYGLLYPVGRELPKKNHNMLTCSFVDPPWLPRVIKQAYGNDAHRLKAAFDGFVQALEAAVNEAEPDIVVLSGEMLFRPVRNTQTHRKAQMLRDTLHRLARDITVVAYVRSPAKYYLSLVQQGLRGSSGISLPRPITYQNVLEFYGEITRDVRVFTYERSRLLDGDITRDFLHRLAPALLAVLPAATTRQSNRTLSAEGMDILQRYRARNHPGANDVFTQDTFELIQTIEALEDEIEPLRQPSLHPSIRDYVNGASVDVLWLRERHGIIFSDVDYDRVSEGLPPPDPPGTIADVCPVDDACRDRLLAAIRARAAGAPWLDHMLGALRERAAQAFGGPHRASGAPVPHDAAWLDRTLIEIHAHLVERTGPVRFTSAHPARGPVSTPCPPRRT